MWIGCEIGADFQLPIDFNGKIQCGIRVKRWHVPSFFISNLDQQRLRLVHGHADFPLKLIGRGFQVDFDAELKMDSTRNPCPIPYQDLSCEYNLSPK